MVSRAATARKQDFDPHEALGRAQTLFYDVCDARTAKKRIAIAKKALSISPLCADAYVLLAEHEKRGSDEALDLWRRGVEAGKTALGDDFEDFQGEFWGFLETRPYMRARFGLAWALWERGEHDEAISHLQSMLVLNPNDNQGVRYVLADWLIETERDDELAVLLNEYREDIMADWAWTTALAAYRREGDSKNSRKLLKDALTSNEHISAYLLGEKALPKSLPPFISLGGVDEAVHYVNGSSDGWHKTPGAIDWLRAQIQPAKKQKPKKPAKS
ncbi:MAG: tetratricopeptide repeat protein [Rhodomicrobium sp.]|nr:tetratricopeptide repeat protein [Rhodomicrobium sp.]